MCNRNKNRPLQIDDSDSINTSFPNFKDELNKLGGKVLKKIITVDGPAASVKERISKYIKEVEIKTSGLWYSL